MPEHKSTCQRHEIHADLLVAGGGMAGVCAAIAAAREGAKVVLVQDRSVLGGNASSEIRMHICGADCHGSKKGWRESGIIEELRLEDAVRNPDRCFPLWDVILYEKVTAEPNITLLLDTDVVGVEAEYDDQLPPLPPRTNRLYQFSGPRGRIRSARAVRELSEDEFIIHAKFFADCTGDGRLGMEARADFRIGRESRDMHGESLAQETDDIQTLGSSILITSRKTDHPVPFVPPPWARKFDPDNIGVGRTIRSWEYGFWWIEWGGNLDTIKDNHTIIRRELYAIALGLWDAIKNSGKFPESANWALDWIGAIPGKRESRRFIGEHILTQQDVLTPARFEDEVAYGGWAIDLHPPLGLDAKDEPPFTPTGFDHVYPLPLRCLYSRNIENLFFAGRNISATHVAFASTRVMATCAIAGEAVGHTAAYCAREGLTPSQLVRDRTHLGRYQQQMLRHDVTLLHTRSQPSLASSARVTASSSDEHFPATNVLDGVTRDELHVGSGELVRSHAWRSGPMVANQPQWIELTWDAPVNASEIHFWFDTGFQRQLTLSANDSTNRTVIRGPQPETVRDYQILLDGQEVVSVSGNYQRKRVHRLDAPRKVSRLRLVINATNGAPEARLFGIAVY